MQLKETEKAYLAGLIDGEGCVHISVSQGRYFQLKLVVSGTVHEHIKACADMTGLGSIHFQIKDGTRADQTQWHLASQQAAQLLRAIMPYLILKGDQARLGLMLQEHIDNGPNYNNRHPMPRAVLNYRQRMADILKEMKANGKTFQDLEFEDVSPPVPDYKQRQLL